MGREQIFGTHQRAVQHHRSYIYLYMYIRTLYTYYIYQLDSSRPSTDSFEGRILCRSFRNTVYTYMILLCMFRHETGTCYGDSVTPIIYDRSRGFKNNAEKVIMIHNFVGVCAERNKSILAIGRRNNIILCSLAQYCRINFHVQVSRHQSVVQKY